MVRHWQVRGLQVAWLLLVGLQCCERAHAGDEPISITGPSGTLGGTWRPAEGARRTVAVIIPGSGPTDRDGNSPLGIKAAPYRLLAEALSAAGIATIRIDKRGMFSSREAAKDANDVRLRDYSADVAAWTAEGARRAGRPCAWIIGHSEGSTVALLTAATMPTGICGVVSLAGPGRSTADVLRQQLRANPANAPILPEALEHIATLERRQRIPADRIHPALLPLFHPAVQGFVMDLMANDPADLASASNVPLLILGGTTDLQIAVADAERLRVARPDARLVMLAGVNHVLKSAPADLAQNFATYANPELPLAPGVAEAIASFLHAH